LFCFPLPFFYLLLLDPDGYNGDKNKSSSNNNNNNYYKSRSDGSSAFNIDTNPGRPSAAATAAQGGNLRATDSDSDNEGGGNRPNLSNKLYTNAYGTGTSGQMMMSAGAAAGGNKRQKTNRGPTDAAIARASDVLKGGHMNNGASSIPVSSRESSLGVSNNFDNNNFNANYSSSSGGATMSSNFGAVSSSFSPAKIQSLIQIPVNILKAFNGGDIPKVREMVKDVCLKTCALSTPALDNDLFGSNYVGDFFEAIYDSHPDAVWVAKKSRFVPERSEVTSRLFFAGTRIASSSSSKQSSSSSSGGGKSSDYLFRRQGATLLDEMDLSTLSEAERFSVQELDAMGGNMSLFGKGTLTLLIDEATGKISKFSMEWNVTSFRQAVI
jgi:hypothetical protein